MPEHSSGQDPTHVNRPLGVNYPNVAYHTIGDKPVDTVDNSVTPRSESVSQNAANRTKSSVGSNGMVTPSPESGQPESGTIEPELQGADLARAALAAARAAAHSKPAQRSTTSATRKERRRWSRARADDRDPQPLGRLAARLASEQGWTQRLADGQVFSRWEQLVGPDLSQHAKPVALNDKELVVKAESTAWATQIRLLQRQLLQRIAAGIGPNVVTRLNVQGPSGPSWQFGPLRTQGRGPRDTYG